MMVLPQDMVFIGISRTRDVWNFVASEDNEHNYCHPGSVWDAARVGALVLVGQSLEADVTLRIFLS